MAAEPRKIIKLMDHQHKSERSLIESEMVPDGQFIRRWTWWRNLVETFNEMNDVSFSPEQIHHYVMTLRKRPLNRLPRWEALGDGCAKMPGKVYLDLSADERAHLVKVYTMLAKRLGAGSDSILVNVSNRKELANMFAAEAGHGINDRSLIAAVIDLCRKEGVLPEVWVRMSVRPRRSVDLTISIKRTALSRRLGSKREGSARENVAI